MKNKGALSKILAVAGAGLVWVPILAPMVFAIIRLLQNGSLLFDYLMPAELFPAVLLGGGLLFWAAWRAHSHRALIGGSLGMTILLLLAAVGLAGITGLASGAIEPEGWPWALVLAAFAGFWIALLTLAVGGILLLRALLAYPQPASGK
jgi:hypothetical protein